jgi:hypothetical protein
MDRAALTSSQSGHIMPDQDASARDETVAAGQTSRNRSRRQRVTAIKITSLALATAGAWIACLVIGGNVLTLLAFTLTAALLLRLAGLVL